MPDLSSTTGEYASLKTFAERINYEHYYKVELLCKEAIITIDKAIEANLNNSSLELVNIRELIAEASSYIRSRRSYFIMYVQELYEKVIAQHNCSTCSGTCHLRHIDKLLEIQKTHLELKQILHHLQFMSLSLYSQSAHPGDYKIVSDQVGLIENLLTDLLNIESTQLVPRIIEAQNAIRAH